ncbi:NUDIX domain protein [Mycobacterium intracellulare 1956]|uniref:NUDIX domain protein n=1 Tax=Mycobacterium intracellulare 1956 TaxID=1299331 RepID=X8CD40_MYCIT|nr:NUDIX domain protein [Mycobacterium intracellulare 1956]
MSDGEQGKPRRRRGRRRGRGAAASSEKQTNGQVNGDSTATKPRRSRGSRRGPERLRTVHETSAGGLVIDGLDGPRDSQVAALIGRIDRRGRMLWSLPKGHIELGETAEQTAIREVAEETGIKGSVLAALGRIDYWFVTDGRRVHKTVHHYLMRFSGGELSDEDLEVAEVAWVPMQELPSRLAYADERRLARVADELIDKLQSDGPSALPRCRPARRGAARRRIRGPGILTNRPRAGRTATDRGRDGAASPSGRLAAHRGRARHRGRTRGTRRAGGSTRGRGRAGGDAVRTGSHRPGHPGRGHHDQSTRCDGQRHGDQHRRPPRSRRHGPARARRRGHHVRGLAHHSGRRHRPVRGGRRFPHRGARTAARAKGRLHPVGPAARADQTVAGSRKARHLSGFGQRQRHARLRRSSPAGQCALPAAGGRGAARPRRRRGLRRRARYLQTRGDHHAVAAGRSATAGPGVPGEPSRSGWSTTTWRPHWPAVAGSTSCCRRPRSRPATTSTPTAPSAARCVWRSTPTCWSPSTR